MAIVSGKRRDPRVDALLVRCLSLIIVASAALAGLSATSARMVQAEEHTIHEFNMANGNPYQTDGDAAADEVISRVNYSSPRPIVVALNEVCEPQYLYMLYVLTGLGYKGYQTETVFNTPRCPNRRFGNAVFVLGTVVAQYGAAFPTQELTDREKRDFVCLDVNLFFQQWTGCVGHLDPSSVKYTQANEFLYLVQARFGGGRTLAAGDFNIRARDPSLSSWYSSHRDGLGLDGTTDTGIHIDYVWADNSNTLVGTPNTVGSSSSDHRYCFATVYF